MAANASSNSFCFCLPNSFDTLLEMLLQHSAANSMASFITQSHWASVSPLSISCRVMLFFSIPYTKPALKLSPAPMVLTVSSVGTGYCLLNPFSALSSIGYTESASWCLKRISKSSAEPRTMSANSRFSSKLGVIFITSLRCDPLKFTS